MSCSYCYQRVRDPRSMKWPTARAAADLALSTSGGAVELTFYGGEPLLEFDLLRRTVEHVEDDRAGRPVTYWVVTNGTLITDEIAAFLAEHNCRTQISFDGVIEAQDLRARGTFQRLERVIDSMRRAHREYFTRSVEISITVPSEAVPYMAASVEYFLGKDVHGIDLTPVVTPSPAWTADRIPGLEKQFERILAVSLSHLARTGRVPLKLYGGEGLLTARQVASREMCEIVGGNSWAVDVDGTVAGCVLYAPSIGGRNSRLLAACHDALTLGHISDTRLNSRLAGFPDAVRALPPFVEKEKKHSSYRRCVDCRFFAACVTCPASIGFIEGNVDPHRVPDYYCAFNYTSLASRDGFPVRPTDLEVIRGDRFRDLRRKWKRIGEQARCESRAQRVAAGPPE
jgi:sulfatase maturation enzyme AslB (radical SAM superfamily)